MTSQVLLNTKCKSRARAKILKEPKSDKVNPEKNSKINIAFTPVNNRNIESVMMSARKSKILKIF